MTPELVAALAALHAEVEGIRQFMAEAQDKRVDGLEARLVRVEKQVEALLGGAKQ